MTKYRVIKLISDDWSCVEFDDEAALLAYATEQNLKMVGRNDKPWTHAWMQGAPIFSDLMGPFGDGVDEVRYENREAFDVLSA
jgi:hypothetical protein